MFSLLNDSDTQATRIDKNVYDILFTSYNQRETDSLRGHLDKSDALDVFRILQEINKEISLVKLENMVLIDFLYKTDPKLLIGLDQIRTQIATMVEKRKSQNSDLASPSTLRRIESTSTSIAESVMSGANKMSTDYRINYRTKAEMAEKMISDTQKICEAIEAKGMHDMKILKGKIDEFRYQCADTQETINNFELHFIKNNTLVNASEKEMETHLRKFINNWLKNGRALLGTTRLKITSLQEQCQQQRTALITKADLGGMLGPVDFEQLQIKRDDQTRSLDEKNVSLAGLKEVTGKASLALAKEKKVVIAIEQKSKAFNAKMDEVLKGIAKLEQEAAAVENDVESAEQSLKNLKIQVEGFEAPSITDYINKKQELIALEKEEKLLKRKSYIQNIKLKNIAIKLRMQNGRK